MRLLILVSILFSQYSLADCTGVDCSGVTIDRLYLTTSTNLLRIGTSGDESKLNCNAVSDKYINLQLNDGTKDSYAMLLAAHQAQSTFWIHTTGSGTTCEVFYLVSDK